MGSVIKIVPMKLTTYSLSYWEGDGRWSVKKYIKIFHETQNLTNQRLVAAEDHHKRFMLVYKIDETFALYSTLMTKLVSEYPDAKVSYDKDNLKFVAKTPYGTYESSDIVKITLINL